MVNVADIEIGAAYHLYYAGAEFKVILNRIWETEEGVEMVAVSLSGQDLPGCNLTLKVTDFVKQATPVNFPARRTRIVEDESGQPAIEHTPVVDGSGRLQRLTSWVRGLLRPSRQSL